MKRRAFALAGIVFAVAAVSRAEVRAFYDRYFSWTAIVERYAYLSDLTP